ncbi:MAG: hypothetical protein AAF497_24115 [Planctomycetota bacterium]
MLQPHLSTYAAPVDSPVPVFVKIGVQNEKFEDVDQRVEFDGLAQVETTSWWESRFRKPQFVEVSGFASDREFSIGIRNTDGSTEAYRSNWHEVAFDFDRRTIRVFMARRCDVLVFDESLFATRESWLRFRSLVDR